ncbi:uncharacterized protein FIBRA_08721 [Fibroporia radiculosa]|uniref:Uncharacterized protein n=1 Tax=Fibroporia radiculosa TaxID=599839 RepID=J4I382_9APHY|nr:uncharacterized protein FIBRA_08721 [Fibroporia radiculosa]CCM06457.1 predicted protein [Fibroporia radiculosa]
MAWLHLTPSMDTLRFLDLETSSVSPVTLADLLARVSPNMETLVLPFLHYDNAKRFVECIKAQENVLPHLTRLEISLQYGKEKENCLPALIAFLGHLSCKDISRIDIRVRPYDFRGRRVVFRDWRLLDKVLEKAHFKNLSQVHIDWLGSRNAVVNSFDGLLSEQFPGLQDRHITPISGYSAETVQRQYPNLATRGDSLIMSFTTICLLFRLRLRPSPPDFLADPPHPISRFDLAARCQHPPLYVGMPLIFHVSGVAVPYSDLPPRTTYPLDHTVVASIAIRI